MIDTVQYEGFGNHSDLNKRIIRKGVHEMIQGIIYSSTTGSGKYYAEELSRKLAIPAYPAKKCPLAAGFEVVFVGWLLAGKMVGLSAALKKYKVRVVVPVGMGDPAALTEEMVRGKNGLGADVVVFPQQGRFNIDKLPLPMRLIMGAKNKEIASRLQAKAKKTALSEAEKACLKMAETGRGEPATWDDIEKVVEWVKADNNAPDVMRWYEP